MFTIQHTSVSGNYPFWYHLECCKDKQQAVRRANQYVLDNGGYICVQDEKGVVIFGTDPIQLDLDISNGTNRSFLRETARRQGCVS